jgi:hypothetical protein
MDAYLERYVAEAMDAQETRNGIFSRRPLSDRLRTLFRMK